MGIFSRFKDIVTSNLNAMLDHAEDPEKLIRLMLCEMEETLVELKAGCASTMAEASKARRSAEQAADEAAEWERRAELALRAGREDMAREALAERLQAQEHGKALEKELAGFDDLIRKCRDDIRLLEERILHTRDRQRLLTERHNHAQVRRQAREQVRAADGAAVMFRFDSLEQRISRMENEAELAYVPRQKHSDFHTLERDAAVTEQLEALRRKIQP
jgi:phage shock protein A